MDEIKDILAIDITDLEEYCKKKGEHFAKGDIKKGKDGKPVLDKYGNEKIINKVTSTQLRNIFGNVTRIRTKYKVRDKKLTNDKINDIKREITLLKPFIAYANGRDPELINLYKSMFNVIDKTIEGIETELKNNNSNNSKFKSIDNFFSIVEGFIAYHKFYEKEK